MICLCIVFLDTYMQLQSLKVNSHKNLVAENLRIIGRNFG